MVAATNTPPVPLHRASDDPAAIEPGDRTPSQIGDLLRRPFHPSVIKQRQIAGRNIDYVPIDCVIERLNRAAPVWHWTVTDIRIVTMPIKRRDGVVDMPVAQCIGTLEIPGIGKRQGIGTAPCEGTEDAPKIAESDAIKRAATMFGVPGGR